MKHRVLIIAVVCVLTGLVASGQTGTAPNIPDLAWQPQPDWINVKTMGAKGDGKTDDADAINAAFEKATGGNVVYFPAGTYRITKQLFIGKTGNRFGLLVQGHGRKTVILWDAPTTSKDSVMLWPKGSHGTEFNGITWNGNNKAKIGVFHMACGYMYEGDMRHENEAFLNFTGWGIKTISRNDPNLSAPWNPTAEMVIRNCLFENCKKGIGVLYSNEFNWNVEGCEFRNCGVGIRTQAYGYGYYRFNHFVGSKEYDFQVEWGSCQSIKYNTSVGSRRFVWGQRCFIEDCVVKGIQDKDSAVILSSSRGTFIVSDLFFPDWNSPKPPLVFSAFSDHDQEYAPMTVTQKLIVSNVVAPGTQTVWRGGAVTPQVTEIPGGKRGKPMYAAETSFLKESIPMPTGANLNVVLMGAKGDGKTDDGPVIQKAFDYAKKFGKNAWVYFPKGAYKTNQTIKVTGSNFFISGTGYNSTLSYGGKAGDPLFLVNGAHNVHFSRFGSRNNDGSSRPFTSPLIKQTGSTGSFVTYNRIFADGKGYRLLSDEPNGLDFENLTSNDTILINQCLTELHFKNCSQAHIISLWSACAVTVIEGTRPQTGFIGFLSGNTGQIRVYNSQNLVFGDMNVEQSDMSQPLDYCDVVLLGNDGDPAGRVTFGSARQTIQATDSVVRIRNYHGSVNMFSGEWGADNGRGATGYTFAPAPGKNPVFMLFAGCTFCGDKGEPVLAQRPKFFPRQGDTLAILNCHYWDNPADIRPGTAGAQQAALNRATEALNDFRKLGSWAYKLDYNRSYVIDTTNAPQKMVITSLGPTDKPSQPKAPVLKATGTDYSHITLIWEVDKSAEGCIVERKTTTGTWEKVGECAAINKQYVDALLTPLSTHTYRIRVFSPGGYSDYSAEASATTPKVGTSVVRINCGGPACENFDGDEYFTGGKTFGLLGAATDVSAVKNPPPQRTYVDERYDTCTYTITALEPQKKYLVRFHIAEIYATAIENKSFSININDKPALVDYEILKETAVPFKAVVKEYPVLADNDGSIRIQFKNGTSSARLNALEVVPMK